MAVLLGVVACSTGGDLEIAPSATAEGGAPPSASSAEPSRTPDEPRADAAVARDAARGADASDTSRSGDPNDPLTIAGASCHGAVPSGGARSLTLPTYAGTCPVLAAPPAVTTLTTSGTQRSFLVFRPATLAPGEDLPVVFLFHWLGGSPDAMASRLDVQAAVDARRFIGVVPVPKGDLPFRWPFESSQSQGRVDEEAVFFDDMLACVGAALPVDKECVSSVGISAGALWTAQLGRLRSERLASIISLSGGTGGGIVQSWTTTPHRLPSFVLWGGSDDVYPSKFPVMNFQNASRDLAGALANDGHFLLECVHNCGHAVPPFDPPASGGLLFDPVWRFVLDHPYWLPASKSPYVGKPLSFPSWCGAGANSATPRANGSVCPG